MYRYLFLCRIYPKSGLDVAKHNTAIGVIENIIGQVSEEDPYTGQGLEEALSKYKEETEGYVLEMVPIVSDNIIKNPEEEVMPEIRSKYAGAELVRYLEIPENFDPVKHMREIATEKRFT